VKAIDVLRHRSLEQRRWVEPAGRDGLGERLHLGPGGGRERQDVPNPAADQLGVDGDDGAVQEAAGRRQPGAPPRARIAPVGALRFTQRCLDEHEQRPPLGMLDAQSIEERSAGPWGTICLLPGFRQRRR